MQYEVEQALLRMEHGSPSADIEWRKLEKRMLQDETVSSRRSSTQRYWWMGAAAAVLLLLSFIWWQQNNKTDKILLSESATSTVSITTPDSENTEEKHKPEAGVIISRQMADYTHAASSQTNVVAIPQGQVYKIVLNDSTQVWMNAGSRLTFPSRFIGSTREVQLEGEAYFQVTKDNKHPFIVHTNHIMTEVLGTEFNIRAYSSDDTHVTLVQGSVKVKLPTTRQEILLRPGQDVSCTDSTYTVSEADTRYVSLWKEGRLYFDNVSLKDLLTDLGRYYNLTVEMENDTALMNTRLHFVVDRNESIDQIIENLNLFEYLSINRDEEKISVKAKK